MPRKISRKGIIKKLDKICVDLVRERDNHTCQHCGKTVTGSNEHVSHVIPRSAGNHLRWNLKNLKVLCFHCHINWWHKNPTVSGQWFKNKFPNRWRYLNAQRNTLSKFKTWELVELYEELSGGKCTKCSEPIKSDEDSICGKCI